MSFTLCLLVIINAYAVDGIRIDVSGEEVVAQVGTAVQP